MIAENNITEEDKSTYLENIRKDFQAKIIFIWLLVLPILLLSMNEVLPVQDAMDKGQKTIIQGKVTEKKKSVDGEKNYLMVENKECRVNESLFKQIEVGEKILHEQTAHGSIPIRTLSASSEESFVRTEKMNEKDKNTLKTAFSNSMYILIGSVTGGIMLSIFAWYTLNKRKKRANTLSGKTIEDVLIKNKNKYLFYYVIEAGDKKYFVNYGLYKKARLNDTVRIHSIPKLGMILKIE